MDVYLITDLLHDKQYIGAEKKYCPEYFGSGKLIKKAIEKFSKENFKKEIIIGNEYINNWEECLRLESACILSFDTLKPNGYNILFWNWPFPFEILSKAGKIGGKIGGKKAAKTNRKNKTGFFALGMQSKGGKIGGRIVGKKNKELKRGWFAPGVASKGGRKGGKIGGKIGGKKAAKTNRKNKTGFFDPKIRMMGSIEGGKMSAYIYFEIDGLIQQMTLGKILKERG